MTPASKGAKREEEQAQNVVELSAGADAQLAEIEAKLAAAEIAPERPHLEPIEINVTPTQNPRDNDPPLYPSDPIVMWESLAPIQNTAWRVNPYMLNVLRQMKKEPSEKGAYAQANQYKDAKELFYGCRFDWRGRVYQRGGRLQYTSGDDAARSLLEFAHGTRLTADGYNWLAAHVATCYGVRGPLMDRVVWTHSNEQQIRDAVADPLGWLGFWYTDPKTGEAKKEAYRFLAACHAWVNKTEPVHLPVTADGTASGFQHYAWLLRNEPLGELVNLGSDPLSNAPGDFYSTVAERAGYERADVKGAAWGALYGKVPGWKDGRREPWEKAQRQRAVDKALKSQRELVPVMALYRAIEAAAKVETHAGRAIEWTLPDGFRVRQANRETDSRKVELWLHGWEGRKHGLGARQTYKLEGLDPDAQADGLPPNLIHSFDACLLRRIVRSATTITRWGVAHDSLGVHPNDGRALRQAVRDAVLWLYGPDRLAALPWLPVSTCEGLPDSLRGGWYTFS